jgi:hypothetical protein
MCEASLGRDAGPEMDRPQIRKRCRPNEPAPPSRGGPSRLAAPQTPRPRQIIGWSASCLKWKVRFHPGSTSMGTSYSTEIRREFS